MVLPYCFGCGLYYGDVITEIVEKKIKEMDSDKKTKLERYEFSLEPKSYIDFEKNGIHKLCCKTHITTNVVNEFFNE